MSCCTGNPEMKNLNHVRILAKAYGKIEGIDLLVIFETNIPPIGKAYDFEPAAWGKKDIVEVVDLRDNPSQNILSDNVGRKPVASGKGKSKAVKKEDFESGSGGGEVLGDTGEIFS